jgi:HD-like signal output (HDOD) protein/CheY-like chemotaxis protein
VSKVAPIRRQRWRPKDTALRRILFVDDEPHVLTGLRNSLRARRNEWECVFLSDPGSAIAALAERPFDVVVSDMRMPKVDGAQVLAAAKRLQPRAARIILSGQTELDSVKSIFVAHVFLAKPCDPEALQKVVDRSCQLLALLDRDDLRAAIGAVEMLPPAPRTYVELTLLLARGEPCVADVARIIERDLALSAKVLQLSSSAFFGLPRKITSLTEAVAYLGTLTLKNLALAVETFSSSLPTDLSAAERDALSRYSLRTGRLARRLAGPDTRKAEEAFLAGLLHAVGQLLPISSESLSPQKEPYWPLFGAYLLGLWGLPHAIIEAIAHHQNPRALPHDSFELVDIVHLAHHLAMNPMCSGLPPGLDREHLAALGYDDQVLQNSIADARRCLEEDDRSTAAAPLRELPMNETRRRGEEK